MFFRSAALTVLCVLIIACSPKPAAPAVERMAVLRFENLGADPSDDWMGRAFAEILTGELANARDLRMVSSSRLHSYGQTLGIRPASAPGISAERPLALAAGATRIAYGDYTPRPGRVTARLTIEDPASGRMIRVLSTSAPDVYNAATNLASQIAEPIEPFPTRNQEALRAYATALESDGRAAIPQLEQAIASDPNFGPPYELLAQFKSQQQDRAGAEAALEAGLARGDAIRKADRARIQFDLANLHGDAPGRLRALAELTSIAPRDAAAWRSLGDTLMAAHDYPKAADAYRKSVVLEQDDVNSWNQLGYASAYAGDMPAAMNALRRYQSLRPADANPIDSLGDVSLMGGRLGESEGFYLEAAKKAPAFLSHADLFKAAMARLMTGDIAGADALAKNYADARAASRDPQAPLFRAEWSWLTGRRRQALREMGEVAQTSTPPLNIQAANQIALWNLMLGDRAAAGRAVESVQPPAAAAIPRFLLLPPAPAAEWTDRGTELLPNPAAAAIRDTAVSTALLLARDFAGASPILKRLYDSPASVSDPSAPIALAWTLIETGRTGDAVPLLQWNPIPPPGGPGALVSLYFPRLYYLRAIAAAKDGKGSEARSNYQLFLKLSGPDPLLWGEEQKARAALK